MEETGLEDAEVVSLGYIMPDAGIIAARVHVYLALSGSVVSRQLGEMGLREFRLFTITDFERMIRGSEIQDSFTLAAWCRFRLSSYGQDKSFPPAHSPDCQKVDRE
jgi:hypothetical protein